MKSTVLILAIDTTTEHGSLALARDADVLECRELRTHQAHGTVVFDEIGELLERHGVALPDIELYAAAAGPGSFTGVRVGLAAAKAFAAVHGKPVAPVSNLAAAAAMAPAGPRILIPVLDARRGEWYAGAYERDSLQPLMEEVAVKPAMLEEHLAALNLPPEDTAFCGPDVERLPLLVYPRLVTGRLLAPAIARLSLRAHREGRTVTAAAADANYVRRPV